MIGLNLSIVCLAIALVIQAFHVRWLSRRILDLELNVIKLKWEAGNKIRFDIEERHVGNKE